MKTTPEIIADIAESGEAAETPQALRDALMAFHDEHRERVNELRIFLLAIMAEWIERGETAGADRELLDRTAAAEAVLAGSFAIRALKVRQGEPFLPGRFALVAYTLADIAASMPKYDEAVADAEKLRAETPDPNVKCERCARGEVAFFLENDPSTAGLWVHDAVPGYTDRGFVNCLNAPGGEEAQPSAQSRGGSAIEPSASSPPVHGLDTQSQVFFYEQDFYVLSNFSAFNLLWKHTRFETSEAAYHWEKFMPNHPGVAALISEAASAHDAFKIAERYRSVRRPDWDAVKVDIMRDILRAKADQHEYVRRKLLATGDRVLIENSWRDDFWGWGPNRDGRNMLGRLWMEVRAELRSGMSRERT